MPPQNVLITKNGDVIVLTKDKIEIKGCIESGDVAIDNNSLSDIDSNTLKDRSILSKDGFVVAHIVINRVSKKIEGHPEIMGKGLGYSHRLKEVVEDLVLTFGSKEISDIKDFRQVAKDHLKKVIKRITFRSPMILVVVSNS
jgi:ribonuclease J